MSKPESDSEKMSGPRVFLSPAPLSSVEDRKGGGKEDRSGGKRGMSAWESINRGQPAPNGILG